MIQLMLLIFHILENIQTMMVGLSYTAQIRCTTTNTTTDITYYPWTGGAPEKDIQINTNTDIKYVTATLCNYFPALTICTEHIPC